MSVHRTSANRELPRSSSFGRGIARPAPRQVDKSGLLLKGMAYFGAICVIGWLVITFGDSLGDAGAEAQQVRSSPVPAPTVAPTVAPPSYLEDGDAFDPGEGAQTAEYWTSGPNPAIPPSQDPLTRQHY